MHSLPHLSTTRIVILVTIKKKTNKPNIGTSIITKCPYLWITYGVVLSLGLDTHHCIPEYFYCIKFSVFHPFILLPLMTRNHLSVLPLLSLFQNLIQLEWFKVWLFVGLFHLLISISASCLSFHGLIAFSSSLPGRSCPVLSHPVFFPPLFFGKTFHCLDMPQFVPSLT